MAVRAAMPADWILPPLDGELSGEVLPLLWPGAPAVHWRVTVRTAEPRVRSVAIALDGPGARLRGTAQLDPRAEGAWSVDEAVFELSQWMPALRSQLGSDFAGLNLGGTVSLAGTGEWRSGVLAGRATLTVRDGWVDFPERKMGLDGVALVLEVTDLGARRTARSQVLSWTGGRYDVVGLGPGRIVFGLDGEDLRIERASLSVLGGELTLGPVALSFVRPELSVTAEIVGVQISQILALLPPILSTARGRLDGQITLARDADGVRIGAGRLGLRDGETADLRLNPAATSLSARLPPDVQKLYPGLVKLETGGVPLRAELLEVTLTPQGDALGRSASVHLVGGPADPSLRAPIDLTLNVRGPLESIVKFGTDSRLRFGGAR